MHEGFTRSAVESTTFDGSEDRSSHLPRSEDGRSRLRRRADRLYLRGRIDEAIDLYGEILDEGEVDLSTLAALREIGRLLARIGAADPQFLAMNRPVARRLRRLLAGGETIARR